MRVLMRQVPLLNNPWGHPNFWPILTYPLRRSCVLYAQCLRWTVRTQDCSKPIFCILGVSRDASWLWLNVFFHPRLCIWLFFPILGRRGQPYEGHSRRGHHWSAPAKHRDLGRGRRQHQVAENAAFAQAEILFCFMPYSSLEMPHLENTFSSS